MMRQILKVKDDEFQTLLSCFVQTDESNPLSGSNFSNNLMKVILRVIKDKKDTF